MKSALFSRGWPFGRIATGIKSDHVIEGNKSNYCLFTPETLAELDTELYDVNRTKSKLGKGRRMSMKKIDFESMSFDDLWSLHEQISQILAVRITSEKRELERRLAVLNRSRGMIEGADKDGAQPYNVNGKARRAYPRVLPKYRNPQTSETWSGRGKQPRWLVAAIKTGHRIEEFEIGASGASKGRRRQRA